MKLPIRTRLTAVYCGVFCASLLVVETAAYFVLTSSIHSIVDRELQVRLEGLTGYLDHHLVRLPMPKLQTDLKGHAAFQPDLLAVREAAPGGAEILVSNAMRTLTPVSGSSVWKAEVTGKRTIPVRALAAQRTIRGTRYNLTLATDMTVPDEVMAHFRWLLIVTAPLIFACASIAGYWISGRALAPVSNLIREARQIGAGNLSSRVQTPSSGDEIQELAVTLNGMLSRIDESFRHVRQFTADASHELRTPLAVIRATAEVALLRTAGNSATYQDALHRILREAEKNTALLDNLLKLAGADSGATSLKLVPLSLGRKVAQACERVHLLAEEKDLTLHVSAGTGLDIRGDADHLLRLCLILLDNAIKYTPRGGRVDAIVSADSHTVWLEVRDTGIGISAQDLPRIFGRFFRADDARTKGSGTGLGLAIAQWIAHSHQGSIHVTSEPGVGSSFRVEFPALSTAAGVMKEVAVAASA